MLVTLEVSSDFVNCLVHQALDSYLQLHIQVLQLIMHLSDLLKHILGYPSSNLCMFFRLLSQFLSANGVIRSCQVGGGLLGEDVLDR